MVTAEQIQPDQLRPLKRAEYDQLVNLGVFEDERLELLGGMIVAKSPQRSPQKAEHSHVIQALTEAFFRLLASRGQTRVQLPLALTSDSEPEPDVSIVPPGKYKHEHPTTAWLIVEVSGDSLRKDRELKGKLYARSGIPEYWICNLVDRVVEVHRDPTPDGYAHREMVPASGSVVFQRFADVVIPVSDFMP